VGFLISRRERGWAFKEFSGRSILSITNIRTSRKGKDNETKNENVL